MNITKALLIGAMVSMAGLAGCATTHENVAEHHHHEDKAKFDGKCAYSVANGKYDIAGKPDYRLVHNGVTYYFSNEDAKNKFKEHVDESVKRANRAWEGGGKLGR